MQFLPFQWVDLFSAMARPSARLAQDLSVLQAHQVSAQGGLGLPPGLSMQWLGTAGFRFTYQGYTILTDPYFTRPSMRAVASRAPVPINDAEIRKYVTACDAVLLGHTHFDHAMDTPAIARMFGAKVYGSSSLRKLMALYGLADQAVEVACNKTYHLGPFEVTFVGSLHSKLALGLAVPSGGEFTCDHLDDLSAGKYRCGETYGIHIKVAGVTFYHQGSANLIDENIVHRDIDFFLAGIAGRSFTPRYFERILTKLKPKVVIPHHFDDFFRPLDQPTKFSLNVNMEKFVDEVRAVSTDIEIRTLELRQEVAPQG
jgi:L-ascorbate metabolism protein UlaG (beta-lactamase superfamily)